MAYSHSVWRVIGMCCGFAALHSLLASRLFKRHVARLAGKRHYEGLYRLAFVLQSVITAGWAAAWFLRLPDRELYHIRGGWAWLLRSVQLASLAMLFSAVRVVGVGRAVGVTQVQALLRGDEPQPTPEAQGPARAASGDMDVRGSFRFTRHPANLSVFGVFWCFPRMTVNRAALAAVLSLYAVLGSLHEEHRLRAAYGPAFDRYAQQVPFMTLKLRKKQ